MEHISRMELDTRYAHCMYKAFSGVEATFPLMLMSSLVTEEAGLRL